MKKPLILLFGLLAMIALFFGCAKKDNNNAPSAPSVKNWAMGATIGGVAWQTDAVTGDTSTDALSGITSIVVGGVTYPGDSQLAIGVEYGIGPGNYDLSKGQVSDIAFVINRDVYRNISGTLYISYNTGKYLEGLFNATIQETSGNEVGKTLTISNGYFRVSY